jgi:hypothetical protein
MWALARSVLLDSLHGNPQASWLDAIDAGANEGARIRLRYPVPGHLAGVKVSAFAHCLAFCIVVQEFNCRNCDGIRVPKGDQRSASIIQKFCGVPVWGRDDRLPSNGPIRTAPRKNLALIRASWSGAALIGSYRLSVLITGDCQPAKSR